MKRISKLCMRYNLGNIIDSPNMVAGGLMHKMYHVRTDKGEYAIKILNPDIMKRPKALANMVNSELVSNALIALIPLVAAKSFEGKNIIELEGTFFEIFDWLEGKSIFVPDITVYHNEQVGKILGKIHASHIEIASMVVDHNIREEYAWSELIVNAKECNLEIQDMLQENLADIIKWDKNAVYGLREISKYQVISHRDLDPKNVMWNNDGPYIIDWEAAGYVNPYQELIEVLNYWISNELGKYDREKFNALMTAYTDFNDISNVNWKVVLCSSFDGMLGWLEYNLKRALSLEGTGENDQQEGIQQTIGTISELKKYENQIGQLKDWIDEFVRKKYTL